MLGAPAEARERPLGGGAGGGGRSHLRAATCEPAPGPERRARRLPAGRLPAAAPRDARG